MKLTCLNTACGNCEIPRLPQEWQEGVAATVDEVYDNHTREEVRAVDNQTLQIWVDEADCMPQGYLMDKPAAFAAAVGAVTVISMDMCASRQSQ